MDYYGRGRSPSPGRGTDYGRNTTERRHKIDPWGRDDEVNNGSSNREGRDSRSRDVGRDRRRSRSRSRSHDRYNKRSPGRDLYKEIIDKDYEDRYSRDRYRSRRDRSRDRDRDRYRSPSPHRRRRRSRSDSEDSYDYQNDDNPNNKIIVRGLASHLTEADISSDLINCGLKPVSVRLIRKSKTGASRGFAFVEFETVQQAKHWMTSRQGCLLLQDHYKASIHYSFQKQKSEPEDLTDWYCGKCGVFNFKRRGTCFKCNTARETCAGEGSDEVSNVLTKKIILRNLDVLTNEERVLTSMQELVPSLVAKISQILICRDPLTQTSRGICYLNFENLVDSMNTYNALKALEPSLKIDSRQVMISYCTDGEKQKKESRAGSSSETTVEDYQYQYTLADVHRLAEYSAGLYATNSTEHTYYIKYYTDYYTSQISSGQMVNFPTQAQLGEANNGAAVALSAIQRKMGKSEKEPAPVAKKVVEIPKGNDGKKYPAPNPNLYDETSGYYFDANTGLYYDAMSHYYYNNETGAFLYWDQENSTYIQANTAFGAQQKPEEKKEEEVKKKKDDKPQDKVKVAKKIVKDMEKWAKQLNQKKEMVVAPPPPSFSREEPKLQMRVAQMRTADVGFSILEKKDRNPNLMGIMAAGSSKLVSYGSDSDEQQEERPRQSASVTAAVVTSEKDYIDFDKLTCNVCKRAFPSLEVLQKHLSMSQLHKDNLQKFNLTRGILDIDKIGGTGYRDRAKERRQKYGEADPPPVNRMRERYEREMERQQAVTQPTLAATPIGENNVGNKLLQKMGWTEGQGLGRSNQGRTDIIEAAQRVPSAGLGAEISKYAGSGDDYKTYIKRMMKTRYEQVGP